MDRRKIGLVLGLLAGLVLSVLFVPCGTGEKQEAWRGQTPGEFFREDLDRGLRDQIREDLRPIPDPEEQRAQLQQRLDRMGVELNRAQAIVDRDSRGEQIDPDVVEKARATLVDLISRMEADERALRELPE